MKRTTLIAGFLILFSAFWVMAETREILSDFDGNEWRTWDSSRRADFISGFIAGACFIIEENTPSFGRYMGEDYDPAKAERALGDYLGFGFKEKKGEHKAKESPKPATKVEARPAEAPAPPGPGKQRYSRDEVSLLLEREYRDKREMLRRYSIIGITNVQIVDGLNLFYHDFRNRQIKLPDAIYIVRKQILGASKEEIEAVTEWLRTPDRDRKKLRYKDKEGNLKFADFP